MGLVVCTLNLSTQEAELCRSLYIQGQSGLSSEFRTPRTMQKDTISKNKQDH